MYRKYFKRLFDIVFSLTFILCFWWLYIIVALLVRVKLGSPVIFKQDRPGLDEKIFTMYKFRSMTDAKDRDGNLLSDAERLPRFGKILRSTSLDEIPEMFNVLKGDMSIVGPRPLLIKYLPYYTQEERNRHKVRPGITGWAQVNGRNLLTWDKRLTKDIEYEREVSFYFDIKVIFLTLKKVIKKEDIVVINDLEFRDLDVERGNKW
jgi:undecaprenyl phosphate N,N'-diacetylbacillosamine 1-phosphate transferase